MSARARPQPDPADPPDLRLVPAALLTWLVVILGLTSGWPAAALASGAAALVALLAWVRTAPRRGRCSPLAGASRRQAWWWP